MELDLQYNDIILIINPKLFIRPYKVFWDLAPAYHSDHTCLPISYDLLAIPAFLKSPKYFES